MKLYQVLINPLLPLLLVLALQGWRQKGNRRLLVAALIYLYLVTIPLTPKLLARAWSVADTADPTQKYEAILVAGGIVDVEWYLARQRPPLAGYYRFGHSADRIVAAADWFLAGGAERVLLGDDLNTRPVNEAALLRDFLVAQGLAPGQVVVYGAVRNTGEEAVKAREHFEHRGGDNFLLITSQSHMRRAAATFRKQGLAPALLSVDKLERFRARDLLPTTKALSWLEMYYYEFAGYLKYWLLNKL